MNQAPPVLDPVQLLRIEAVHRGFLYQHLYAAGCLLLAPTVGAIAVAVERDEDVEIRFPARRVYIQIKTRSRTLERTDIESTLARFTELRLAHSSGLRTGAAAFQIVSNVAPNATLSAAIDNADWPSDVSLVWPGQDGLRDPALPVVSRSISDCLAWCIDRASALPFTALAPEILVWKLTGNVLLAAAGSAPRREHEFMVEDLPELFEQIVLQLQDFPVAPPRYRSQTSEPPLLSGQRVRLVTGFSGAGKTSWAANAALHFPGAAIYFDAADRPDSTLAAALARELAGRLANGSKGVIRRMLLPGVRGVEMLRLLEEYLLAEGLSAVVVLDNAHRAHGEDLLALLESTRHLQFVLLGHPTPELHTVRLRLGIASEELLGWSNDTVAAEIVTAGGRSDYATCQRLVDATGGLPLYVQSAIQVAITEYGGDLAAFCSILDAGAHLSPTVQEAILARLYDSLPSKDRELVAILSIANCPLSTDETLAIARQVLDIEGAGLAGAVRRLSLVGVVRVFGNQRLKVHDAIRILGKVRFDELGMALTMRIHVALKNVLAASLALERDVSRFALLVHELGVTGDIDTLVDLASYEIFHEMGLSPDFTSVLERASNDQTLSASLRYWALDAIAFSQLQRGELNGLREHLEAMARFVEVGELGTRERLALGMKNMLFAAQEGRKQDVERLAAELPIPSDPVFARIVKYNTAVSLSRVGSHDAAKADASELITDYYDHLGLESQHVIGKNPKEIWPLLNANRDPDDIKHLADSLSLFAQCCDARMEDSGLARIHAVKFYNMAGAYRSVLNVGQDVVDEFLRRGDRTGARHFMEAMLLPAAQQTKMVDSIVPLRGQYAVILAHCGEFASAEREMNGLLAYQSGLPEQGRQELQRQRRLIEGLRADYSRRLTEPEWPVGKTGRNAPCPCRSGKKFKKCHGAG